MLIFITDLQARPASWAARETWARSLRPGHFFANPPNHLDHRLFSKDLINAINRLKDARFNVFSQSRINKIYP